MIRGPFVRRFNRRQFIQGSGALAAGAATLLAPRVSPPVRASENELTWLCYPGHAAEEVIGPFEQAHGVRIRAQEFSAGERMLALINSSPPGTYDVAMEDSPYMEWLWRADLLEPLDPADYPFDDMLPEFQKWPGLWDGDTLYAVPVTWGFNGLAYNAEVLTAEDVDSYEIMWDERLNDRLGMRDWYLPSMGCLSAYLGHEEPYNISDEQFEELKETMFSLAPSVVGFWGFGGVFDSLADRRAYVIPGCGEWITGLLQRDGHPIRSLAPREGAISWSEANCILKGTTKHDLAVEFIRYLTSPEGQMRTMTKSSYMAVGVTHSAWDKINREDKEAARMVNMDTDDYTILDMYREGRIKRRDLPRQQPLDDWQDAYTQFQNMSA